MLIALAAVAIVLLLALTLVLTDRHAASIAERRASEFLAGPLGRPPVVRIHGRPFLTQAVRGRYARVHVSAGGLRIGEMTGATLDADLQTVHLSARELLGHRAEELSCEQVRGTLVLPFGELARVSAIPGLEFRQRGERLLASAALPIPGLNQLARVNGEAIWTLQGPGSVWLRIRGVSVAGIALPGIVLNQLLPSLDVPVPLPELPYGLRIDGLRPTAAGLEVTGGASGVTFRRPDRPAGPSALRPTGRDVRPTT